MQTFSMKELFGNSVPIAGKSVHTVKNIPAKKNKSLDNNIDFMKQDIPMLNQGVSKMKNNFINPNERVNAILGNGTKADNIMFGTSGKKLKTVNPNTIVSGMFSTKSSHSMKAGAYMGMGKTNQSIRVNSFLGMGNKIKGGSPKVDVKGVLGVEGRAFRSARIGKGNNPMQRIKMQRNLAMSGHSPFGDFDTDRVLNIFDCNPYNKRKQGGEVDNINAEDVSEMETYDVPTESREPQTEVYDATYSQYPTPYNRQLSTTESFSNTVNEEVPKTQVDWRTDIPSPVSQGYEYLKTKGNIASGAAENVLSSGASKIGSFFGKVKEYAGDALSNSNLGTRRKEGVATYAGKRFADTFIPSREQQIQKQRMEKAMENVVDKKVKKTASVLRAAGIPQKQARQYASGIIVKQYGGKGISGIPSSWAVPEFGRRDVSGMGNVGYGGIYRMSSLARTTGGTPLSMRVGQLTGMQKSSPKQIGYSPEMEPTAVIEPKQVSVPQATGRLVYSPYSKRPVTYTRGKYNKIR